MDPKIAAALATGELLPALNIVEKCSRGRMRQGLLEALHAHAAGEPVGSHLASMKPSDRKLFNDLVKKPASTQLVDCLKTLARYREEHNYWVTTRADARYPELLQHTPDAPEWLFGCGDHKLLQQSSVAIVGSRACSHYGRELASWIATDLATLGIVLVSGMAEGIDTAVHRAAVDAGSPTIAVLGSGFAQPFPRSNIRLMHEIPEHGLLMSEYAPDVSARKFQFPERNRIIAGLALGVVVIDAGQRSGALITARQAADAGRSVMAVPGSVRSPTSRGAHRLLRDGAVLVESAEDIVREIKGELQLSLPDKASERAELTPALRGTEATVVAAIDWEGTPLDTIEERTGLERQLILLTLTKLELTDHIANIGWGYRRMR